jgi:hypothetical protein
VSTKTEITTDDLARRLRARCDGTGEVLLFEVGDGPGFKNRGWSDAISMQTWPSKGLALTGYEIKASRSDWLRELDQPAKNKTWQGVCHAWYIVAPKGVVHLEELPATWGLMIPVGDHRLRIASRSEQPGVNEISLKLLTAIFRAVGNHMEHATRRINDEARRDAAQKVEATIQSLRLELRETTEVLAEIKGALGSRWSSLSEIKAVAMALTARDPDDLFNDLEGKQIALAKSLEVIKAAMHSLRNIQLKEHDATRKE